MLVSDIRNYKIIRKATYLQVSCILLCESIISIKIIKKL